MEYVSRDKLILLYHESLRSDALLVNQDRLANSVWSADGRSVYFGTGPHSERHLMKLDVTDTVLTSAYTGQWDGYSVGPDNRRIVFIDAGHAVLLYDSQLVTEKEMKSVLAQQLVSPKFRNIKVHDPPSFK